MQGSRPKHIHGSIRLFRSEHDFGVEWAAMASVVGADALIPSVIREGQGET
jgi:hypothetical protein